MASRKFDTYGAFVDRACGPDGAPSLGGRRSRDTRGHVVGQSPSFDAEWFGTDTFADAVSLATRGWPEGLRLVGTLGANLTKTLGSYKQEPRFRRDTGGALVDIGAYCAGEPEHMLEFEMVETAGMGPLVKIVTANCVSAGVDSDRIRRRGAAIMALVDALENAGKSVEVIVNYNHSHGLEYDVTLKGQGYALSPDVMAFALCHPAAFRRIEFSVAETESESLRKAARICPDGGYGRVTEATERGDIYLPATAYGYDSQFNSDASTLKWLKETLKTQGVEVET